ncbi:MAG: Ig-like domain-containing protein, partial [Longimicrobiales bacterium]
MVLHRIRSTLGAVLAVAALVACDEEPSGPGDAVANVEVEPVGRDLTSGETFQMTAVAIDASGDTVPDKAATWSSSAEDVASVSPGGLVTARQIGSAVITATIEGHSGSTTVSVVCSNEAPAGSSVSSSPLAVGGSATLTGTNIFPCSRLLVNGVRAAVTATTSTSIQFTVPCVAPGNASIVVQNGTLVSAPVAATVTAGAVSTPAVGALMLVSNPMCVQLASAGSESYLIGVQSVSEAVSVLTPVTFGVEAGGATITSTGVMAAGLL